MTKPFSRLLIATLTLLPAACDDGGSEDGAGGTADAGSDGGGSSGEGEDATVDEDAVLQMALEYASFDLVNAAPRSSQHALGDTVNVWVPSAYAEAYRGLDPDAMSPEPSFPEGTLLVKEHLDVEGAYAGLTVMYKAPSGYAPDAADWWWGRVTPAGELAEGGSIGYCANCHAAAEGTGYAFGIPIDEQAP